MASERRSFPRHPIRAQVTVKRDHSTQVLNIKNVSKSGIFVAAKNVTTLSWVKKGQELSVTLYDTERRHTASMTGLITRISSSGPMDDVGFGVTFLSASKEARAELARLVELAAAKSIRPPPLPF